MVEDGTYVLKGDELVMYTIYDRPKDYPDKFVVRAFAMGSDGKQYVSGECKLADSLKEARQFVPPDKVRTERHPGDDPVIVETWI